MKLDVLPGRREDCALCELHTAVHSVCVPSVRVGRRKHKQALFILGEAPGYEEDQVCIPFVGRSGDTLRTLYIGGMNAHKYADVYIGNVVRCRPPQNRDPKEKEMKACAGYWRRDVRTLLKHYERVTILCTGRYAAMQVADYTSLSEAFKHQGAWVCDGKVRAFFVSHPAAVSRDDSRILGLQEHLFMVREYLETGEIKMVVDMPVAEQAVTVRAGVVAFDFETYGFFRDRPDQNSFHPMVMRSRDGVPLHRIIECGSVAYYRADGTPGVSYFNWRIREHRPRFYDSLYGAVEHHGMNVIFDELCARHDNPVYARWMDRAWAKTGKPMLIDLGLVKFVECDVREESSLKDISPLLRVSQYPDELVKKGKKKNLKIFHSPAQRECQDYNCQDSVSTLCDIEIFQNRIREAGRVWDREWWSDVTHLCLQMTEAGIRFRRSGIQSIHNSELAKQARLLEMAKGFPSRKRYLPKKDKWVDQPAVLAAEGSRIYSDLTMLKTVPKLPPTIQAELELTEITQVVSLNDANRMLFLEHLPEGKLKNWWKLYDEFKRSQDITSDITGPLLDRHLIENDFMYPIWRAWPTHLKDGAGKKGGQRQARLSPNPGVVTYPRAYFKHQLSRFAPGILAKPDLSQIELRVPALLSGDEVLTADLETDLHWASAYDLFSIFSKDPVAWAMHDPHVREEGFKRGVNMDDAAEVQKELLRQGGKHCNFALAYYAGAHRVHATILDKTGVNMPMDHCEAWVNTRRARYKRLTAWHEANQNFVRRNGYLVIETSRGEILRRTWAPGACDIDALKIIPEIANFKIQGWAAIIMEAGQVELTKKFIRGRLRTVMCGNHYDACWIDSPANEWKTVEPWIEPALTGNFMLRQLEQDLGRAVPIKYELKVTKFDVKGGVAA